MTVIGIRELKTRLGTYLRLVQKGERIVVTDRGRPVAELRSIAGTEDEDVRLAELAALGLVSPGSGAALLAFEPVPVSGAPVSETLLEDRTDRI